jgi:hypothetical protein
MPYREYEASADAAPRWLLGPRGAAWLESSGDTKDASCDELKAAVKLRFASTAPGDGLDLMGADRMIERAIGETNASYRARIIDAWNLWQFGGTAWGLLRALAGVGYPTATICIARGLRFSLDSNWDLVTEILPGGWTLGDVAFWSRFNVIFMAQPPGWITMPAADDPRVELVRRTIRRWKASFATCTGIEILVSGLLWGLPPSRVWTGAVNWGSTSWHYLA